MKGGARQRSRRRRLIEQLENLFILSYIIHVPGGVGNRLRYMFYRQRLHHLGRNVIIDVGVQMIGTEFISVGDNTWIDKYVILLAGKPRPGRTTYYKENPAFSGTVGELWIGKNCHIAPHSLISGHGGMWLGDNLTVASGSRLYSFSHHYRNLAMRDDPRRDYLFTSRAPDADQAMISGPVVMEDNSALGLNSVILPGVTIGKGSWVGAMSLVSSNIPSGVIAAGNPARVMHEK